MILFTALAAIGAATVLGTILDYFYDDIINWLKQVGEIAKQKIQGVLIGCKTFINVGKAVLNTISKEISKNYSKIGDKWQVTEVERMVGADQIPEEIYQQASLANSDTLELTKDIEAQILKNYQ